MTWDNFFLVFDLTLLQNSTFKSGLSEEMPKYFFLKNEHFFFSNLFPF